MTQSVHQPKPDHGVVAIETFVIIHDQQLLLECDRQQRFSGIGRIRYLFVGAGDVELVDQREDVIVARSLPDNIENVPNLLSFTGWYAIARNKLTTTSHVAILEYDVAVQSTFSNDTLRSLQETHCIVGYVPFRLTHPMYLHATSWFTQSVEKVYGLSVPDMVRDHLARGGADLWTCTTNAAMAVEDLGGFVDWFLPLAQVFQHDPVGAHVHERTIFIYCLLREIETVYLPGVLEHEQARSHQILALSQEFARQCAEQSPPLIPPPVD